MEKIRSVSMSGKERRKTRKDLINLKVENQEMIIDFLEMIQQGNFMANMRNMNQIFIVLNAKPGKVNSDLSRLLKCILNI